MTNNVKVIENINKVIVSSPGAQGLAGRTILNGNGSPSGNLGVEGDFYYNKLTSEFYGPKPSNTSWSGSTIIKLAQEISYEYSWEMAQVAGPLNGLYSVEIEHNLGFSPNVTVKSSAGDVLETGIDYNSLNTLTLTMAQPFSGTAYLS